MTTPVNVDDSDNTQIGTEHVSIAGQSFVIKVTPMGYYVIDTVGVGARPAICEEMFTNAPEARKALAAFSADNAPTLQKNAVHAAAIERRIESAQRKN